MRRRRLSQQQVVRVDQRIRVIRHCPQYSWYCASGRPWDVMVSRRLKVGREGEAVAIDQQPIACTLTSGDLRDRLAWIAMLNRDALRSYDRTDLTLRLRSPPRLHNG